jgi:hypothetical protein
MDDKTLAINDILKSFMLDQAASPETAATRFKHPPSAPLTQRFVDGSENIEDRRGQPAPSKAEQILSLLNRMNIEFSQPDVVDQNPAEYPHPPYFPIKRAARVY